MPVIILTNASTTELMTLLAHAELCISTDTGPLHMAAALNCPLIALHGPTSPEINGPFLTAENREQIKIFYEPPPCSPCYGTERQKNCAFNECMHNISVEKVFEAANDLLAMHAVLL